MRYRQFTNIANPVATANFNIPIFFGRFMYFSINILLTAAGTLNGTFNVQGGNATRDLSLNPPNPVATPPPPPGVQVPEVNLSALALATLTGATNTQAIVNGVPGSVLFTGGPLAFDILNLNWAFASGTGTCQVVIVLKDNGGEV
jgi:hypothetical protein